MNTVKVDEHFDDASSFWISLHLGTVKRSNLIGQLVTGAWSTTHKPQKNPPGVYGLFRLPDIIYDRFSGVSMGISRHPRENLLESSPPVEV